MAKRKLWSIIASIVIVVGAGSVFTYYIFTNDESDADTETPTEDVTEGADEEAEEVEEVEETPDYIGNMSTDMAQEVKIIKEVDERPAAQYGEVEFKVTRAQIQELNMSSTEEDIKYQMVVEYKVKSDYDEIVFMPVQDANVTLNNGAVIKPSPANHTHAVEYGPDVESEERIHTTTFGLNRENTADDTIYNDIDMDPSEITSFSLDFPNIISSYNKDETGNHIMLYQSEAELESGDFEQYEVQF